MVKNEGFIKRIDHQRCEFFDLLPPYESPLLGEKTRYLKKHVL